MAIHVVRSGDTVYNIARRYGVSPDTIINSNELTNPASLVVGQTIVIPAEQENLEQLKLMDLHSQISIKKPLENPSQFNLFKHFQL